MKRFFSVLAATLLAFTACEDFEIPANITIPDADSLELFNSGITFSAAKEGGVQSVSLSFACTVDWSVAIEEMTGDWLTVDPASGSAGSVTIKVSAKDNTSTDPRSAKVTVTCGTLSKSVKVKQEGYVKPDIAVEEVKLDKNSLELQPGQSDLLTATVLPENATDKTVTWSTSNEKVATVKDGKVTAADVGEATITASAGGKKAECKVVVKKPVVEVQSVSLDKTSVQMYAGQSYQLTATVAPENATDKTVTWQSSDTAVATVDDQGLVQTIGGGKAKITAIAGDAKAECEFEVVAQTYATPVALDLGLSVKWASFDLGATAPEQMGYFFAWGETEPGFTEFDRNHYDFIIDGMLTKYCSHASAGTVDNKTQLELEDDAAHVKLGNGWRLPTKEECDELGKCDAYADVRNGVKGFVVVGKNGNTVFFPYNTNVYESLVYDVGKSYSSWTSTRNSSSGLADALQIRFLDDKSEEVHLGATMYTYRFSGYCIRPVKD